GGADCFSRSFHFLAGKLRLPTGVRKLYFDLAKSSLFPRRLPTFCGNFIIFCRSIYFEDHLYVLVPRPDFWLHLGGVTGGNCHHWNIGRLTPPCGASRT